MSGSDTILFNQTADATQLWINGEAGSSARTFGSYARVVTSKANGTIDFTYDPVGNAPFAVAGLAISIVPEPASVSLITIGLIPLGRRRR